jgi:predicted PurR-regulated permease PerM
MDPGLAGGSEAAPADPGTPEEANPIDPITMTRPGRRSRFHHPRDAAHDAAMSADWRRGGRSKPYPAAMDGSSHHDDNPLAAPQVGSNPSWSRIWIPRLAGAVLVVAAVLSFSAWIWDGTEAFLILLIFTVFLAFALEPLVRRLETRGMKRGLAAALVLFGSLITVTVIMWAFISLLLDQADAIITMIPVWVENVIGWWNEAFGTDIAVPESIADLAAGLSESLTDWVDDAAAAVVNIGAGIAGAIAQVFTVVFLLYYAMADGGRMRRSILSPLPPGNQRMAAAVWDTSIEKTGSYVYSRLILGGLSAAFQAIAFWAIGLDNALALGVFVGLVSQLIPNIGTIIGGALPVLVGLVQDPILGLYALIIVTIYQQIENYVFVPRVTKETMDLHPAISFSAVIIGANLLGITGLLLALPATATIQSLVGTYGRRYELIEELAEGDGLESEAGLDADATAPE